jgi:hypothetical protein
MLQQNTRESAIRREEFHDTLRAWLDDSFDARAGDPDSHAGLAWLWVRHGGDHYYLSSDSTRDGIRGYMRAVEESRGDPEWSTDPTDDDVGNRVTVGRDGRVIDGFEFFRHVPGR